MHDDALVHDVMILVNNFSGEFDDIMHQTKLHPDNLPRDFLR